MCSTPLCFLTLLPTAITRAHATRCCCLTCLYSQPEPNALEKKLLRKRQRQEQSDAIAGEMGSHGVTDSIDGEEGESKTASFKAKKKKREPKQPASLPEENATSGVAGGGKKKALQEEGGGPASGGGEGEAAEDVGDGDEGPGEKTGRKRKTKRKKRKAATEEVGEGAEDSAEIPLPSAAAASAAATAAAEGNPPAEAAAEEADGGNPEDPEQGSKKQRRGWGKARSKTAAQAGSEGVEMTDAAAEGAAWERRSRKKTRSKQKNIRKDKRPVGERPAYLRAGDPGFCGRGLTDETRKFLGLPQDDFGSAPPAGWGQPGKTGVSPGRVVDKSPSWVVDKKPLPAPQHSVSRDGGNAGEEPDSGVALDPKREVAPVVEARPSGKSKYKNLALPRANKMSAKKRRKAVAQAQVEKAGS